MMDVCRVCVCVVCMRGVCDVCVWCAGCVCLCGVHDGCVQYACVWCVVFKTDLCNLNQFTVSRKQGLISF